jgi:hypothetical protein
MLDDIEDGSGLGRRQLAKHNIFGIAQTINPVCYGTWQAVHEAE